MIENIVDGVSELDRASESMYRASEESRVIIENLKASSDHTILDIEDAEREFKPGDIVSFGINYASLVYVTNCRNVQIVFV